MPPIDRRGFLALGTLSAIEPSFAQETADSHLRSMMKADPNAPTVTMMVYPNMIALDLVGPMTVFKILKWNIQLVWKEAVPVATDVGFTILANTTFNRAYARPDIFFVPGGLMGTIACLQDTEVINFVHTQGKRAKWITSDCTGSLILGAAGLLDGYRATCNWAVGDLLPLFGAIQSSERVERDQNRLTGAGTTAGIDFGLTLASEIAGEEAARRTQLIIEYSPQPPFRNGTPVEAGPERVAAIRRGRTWMDRHARTAAEIAALSLAARRKSFGARE